MANDAAIIARMRAAQVPAHAYSHSLETLKQKRFSELLAQRKYELGHGVLQSYLITERRRAAREPRSIGASMVCAVAAKELVLQGLRPVRYYTLAEIAQGVRRNEDWDIAPNRGFVVVGDLGENTQQWPADVWSTVQAILLTHLSRGGSLIVGDTGVVDGGWFGSEMLDAIAIFEQIAME